jgi:serine/threonine protein kinase
MAPEIVAGSDYGEKVDIFGAGCVLWFSICGTPPFVGPSLGSILRRTLKRNITFEGRHDFEYISEQGKLCILWLLTKHPFSRPDAKGALQLAWFSDWDAADQLSSQAPVEKSNPPVAADSWATRSIARSTNSRSSYDQAIDRRISSAGWHVPLKALYNDDSSDRDRSDSATLSPSPWSPQRRPALRPTFMGISAQYPRLPAHGPQEDAVTFDGRASADGERLMFSVGETDDGTVDGEHQDDVATTENDWWTLCDEGTASLRPKVPSAERRGLCAFRRRRFL